jgi:hypothetical protein
MAFEISADDPAFADPAHRVVPFPVIDPGVADYDVDTMNLTGQPFDGIMTGFEESRPEQQVLRRVGVAPAPA